MSFDPKYQISPKLLTAITQVERMYGQIEALKVPKKLQLNLNRENLIQSSYASNKIEGNPLTLPEVTNLLLDDRVPTNRDEKEVVNYFGILKELSSYVKTDLSVDLVKEIHKKLLTGVDEFAGKIRNEKVVVGKYQEGEKGNYTLKVKHEPPSHEREEIAGDVTELLEWTQANENLPVLIQTGVFHHHFVYIHPFEDGNGRVCRLLTALLFLKRNYQINKYFVLDDYYDIDRMEYSDMLHSADRGDKTQWLEYFSEGVQHSLLSALAKFESAMKKMRVEERPTPKEQEVLDYMESHPEVTSGDIAGEMKVSRQQAHNLLSSLVEKDYLDRRGSTKSSYYVLK